MPAHFDLIITADTPNRTAELKLHDQYGAQLAYRLTEFKDITLSQQHGLFDLRNYLRHYAAPGEEATRVAEIGVCIAEQVLGAEIFRQLYASEAQRTLRIQLPGATEAENTLAALLARVPWEIARPAADQPTLGERNLLVRVVHEMQESATQPLKLDAGEALRVLFVFAEAPSKVYGSNPLAARQERRELQRLFAKEIYPHHQIAAHFLTHGVTRARLFKQIQENNGYHIVHWSGHGHLNLLELAKARRERDYLSGEELLGLFKAAGGFLPQLFFLSACHSGDILRVKDWHDFAALAAGKTPVVKESATTKDIEFEEQPGYTGTAHALLQGGVPSVVAMRYAVGDEYARDLAVTFYRRLLADKAPKQAAAALTMARKELLAARDQSRYAACDHATPVLYGAAQPDLRWPKGRSPALDTREPRLQQIAELTAAQHAHFVGRTWELADLGADFIGSDEQPVAVITGLGGMGKTALTAEALALWETRFDWVLLYQAKPNALSFENVLRDLHLKLNGELGRYHDHVKVRPADAIYRDASAEFTGAERYERLTRNLIRALKDEAILLVLDNFETNLKAQPSQRVSSPTVREGSIDSAPDEAGGRTSEAALPYGRATDTDATPRWACQDAAWESCLQRLANELTGTRSRVWLTCRHALTALDGAGCHAVLLGPLPSGEAALYLREHAGLSRMFFSPDTSERALAMRLLNASRFHPLLIDRLAKLAVAGDALKPQLLQALDTLERTKDFARLPELFATSPGDTKELAYLNDALAASLDQLIQQASPDARRLLWLIAVANEPIEIALLQDVWSGEDGPQTQELRQIKLMWEMLPSLPPDKRVEIEAEMPPEILALLDALPPTALARPGPAPLLRYLVAVGLVTEERDAPEDQNPALSCHELVRERSRARMDTNPQERAGLSENSIRLAYSERLAVAFEALQHRNMTAALRAGSRAIIYCVQAGDYVRLGEFASGVIISASDPRLLEALLPYLQAAAESAPAGRLRWRCFCYLADALKHGGRPDNSLAFYEQSALKARAVAEAGGENGLLAWEDVAAITGNWATALVMTGDLNAARLRQLESTEAHKQAGSPAVCVIGSELEVLRIEIMQGRVGQALPQVEARLAQVESWWHQHRSGQFMLETPDSASLTRAFISALDIAREAHSAQQDWAAALSCIDVALEVKRALRHSTEDIAATRMNRANVLMELPGRFGEARAELEDCFQIFQNDSTIRARVLSSFANLFDKQGDVVQAINQQRRALALREQLPDPSGRASSHNNLANYLYRSNMPATLTEAPHHQLAALVYQLVAGLWQDLQQLSLRNYVIDFRRAHEAGTPLAVPCVADLLADSAFRPLDDWLRLRQVDVDGLQAAADDLLEQVRQAAIE